jgi:homeobox-leucine zipper protein
LFLHHSLTPCALRVQLDRVSSLTSKYLGRPITQLPPVQPLSMSSLDLSVGGLGSPAALGPSLDLDLLSGASSGLAFQLPTPVSEMERPMMAEMAARAMDEFIRVAQAGDHLWVKTSGVPDAREVLNVDTYDNIFAKPGSSFRGPDVHVEGSRDSGLVFMSAIGLVDVFMDSVMMARESFFFFLRVRRIFYTIYIGVMFFFHLPESFA